MGIACNCEINRFNYYDRKNYFYPDLPKGFQTTQDSAPICIGGEVPIQTKSGLKRTIQLNRIHMEDDAGKSTHLPEGNESLIDLNRAGVPLIEIVTEPVIHTTEEAGAFLTEIRKLVRYLEICDGNMEEGSMRCDANISVRLKGSTKLGRKVEVKNMNSIRNVMRAIDHETARQIELVEKNEEFASETRLFDAVTGLTHSMRNKEELNDYRYFPEPDLQPIVVSDEWLNEIKAAMPALPRELLAKFVEQYKLPEYNAYVLTDTKEIALYFDDLCKHTQNYKGASNWMMGPVKSYLNELTLHIKDFPLKPEQIAGVLALVEEGAISNSVAEQKVFPMLLEAPNKTARQIAEENNLLQEGDEDALQTVINEVIAQNVAKVKEYQGGKKGLLGMFMGQIMKRQAVKRILKRPLAY